MLSWNVYPLFPPGTTPLVMLLVMPSFMPKNLEISLQACFYCPVHHTLPGDTAVRNGGLKRFSPRWKVCYSACNASPEAHFHSLNHRLVLPFCPAKGKITTKLKTPNSFPNHLFCLSPYFHPLFSSLLPTTFQSPFVPPDVTVATFHSSYLHISWSSENGTCTKTTHFRMKKHVFVNDKAWFEA